MAASSGGPPGAGLGAANAAAAAAPKGPPGGAAQKCNWEVYVTTHSQHRFWPGEQFQHQLCGLNGSELAGAQQSANVKMTAPDSMPSKFTGSGTKKFGVTSSAPAIAGKEAGWILVQGIKSDQKLQNRNLPIRVADGQAGPQAQIVDLYLRHPLLIYGQLQFKDPEDREVSFPKDFYVAAYSGQGAKADTEVGHAKLDAEGKFDFEIDRKWDWFTFKFGSGKKFISNGDAKTLTTELKPWSERKALEKAAAKFFAPPATWWLIESDWTFSQDPQYIDGAVSHKPKEGKIYLFQSPTQWVRRIGEKGAPVKMLLDPHWQFLRFEYFDRYYGHTDHGHDRVNIPSTLIEGFWRADPKKMDREGSSEWTLTPDDPKKSVHCLPWIRQKDDQGAKAEKPDKNALIQFETPASTFAVSSDAGARKYEQISASSSRLKPSADRLKLYDMPEAWKSKGYWSRYAKGGGGYDGKFWEDWDQPGLFKSRTKTTPMVFSLDDIVLTDAKNVPLQDLAKKDQFAIFYHRFKPAYNEMSLTEEGVYDKDPAEPFFSQTERKGAKFNYLADYPNWVRLIAGLCSCFDVFDQRTAKEIYGARAAVRWYDGTKGTPAGTVLNSQAKDIAKPHFVIGPEWGQQHASTIAKFVGSKTQAQRIGRFDMVLLRCCDRIDAKELFLNIQYFRINYNFLAAAPASASAGSAASAYAGADGKAFSKPALLALMKRWNGYDGAENGSRAELVPQEKGKDVTGEVLYFLHPSTKLQGAHFRIDVFQSGDNSDRAWMSGTDGTGEVTDSGFGVDNSFAVNSFTAAHELGHGGSLPDEYGEWWMRCNHNGPGVTNNIPGDPFVDEGRDQDLANSLYANPTGDPKSPNPYPMMTMAVEMRNRYFWHNAEFARKHIEIPFYSKHGADAEYKLPGHPKFPYRIYTYWPVRKKMNRKKGKHGATDIYLHALGKEKFMLPGGPWDGMVSILLKIDIGPIPASINSGEGDVRALRDAIRNAILAFNQRFSATGSTGVKTDKSTVLRDDVKFSHAVVRFSPRFLMADVDTTLSAGDQTNYAGNYNYWQTNIGTHFQMTLVDNTGKVPDTDPNWAKTAANKKVIPSGFAAKNGGAITLGVTTGGGWDARLTADVQALLPDMLGIKVKGGVITAKDLTPLVAAVIHSNAKVT